MAEISHSENSTLRERIIEHLFVGDILRRLWRADIVDVEVLRSEFDAHGYDLVMERGAIVRHVQLKTILLDGKAQKKAVSLKLAKKLSGCVILIVVTRELEIKHYLWFGGLPGQPLPDIQNLKVAKHAKANADGVKSERPDQRLIPRSRFENLSSLEAVLNRLFGIVFAE